MSFIDPTLIQKAAPTIEKAINLALSMDPAAQKKLNLLQGCIFEVAITAPKQVLFFGSIDGKVVILPPQDTSSVCLSGRAFAFIKLASTKNKASLFKNKEIILSGDAVRAQQIQGFMASVNIDWEGILASFIGDAPAHIFGSSLRQSLSFGKKLSQSFISDLEEFIKYEVRLIPSKALAKAQFETIDQLRLATDRLEARLKQALKTTDDS
ncbi:MAG: ubiquinone biosynthesis protein UbiJ [Oleiphilaceae bacterium]|jgi:ubiquinone biosynthesis protein UbiJ